MKKEKVDYTNPDTQMKMIVGIPAAFFMLLMLVFMVISDYYAAELVSVHVADGAVHHNLVDGIYMIKTPKEYQTLVVEHGVGRFPFESPKDGEYPIVNLKTLRKIPKCLPEGRRITRR